MLTNLIKLRKGRGLRQKDIAEKLKVGVNTYCYWEKGINEPDIKSLIELSKIFGVSVDYIIDNQKPQPMLIIQTDEITKVYDKISKENLNIIIQIADLNTKNGN